MTTPSPAGRGTALSSGVLTMGRAPARPAGDDLAPCTDCDGFGTVPADGAYRGTGCPCLDCCTVERVCGECGGTGHAPCENCGDVAREDIGNLCASCEAGEDGGNVLEPAHGGSRAVVGPHGRQGVEFMGPTIASAAAHVPHTSAGKRAEGR